MKRSRFSESQIVRILNEADAGRKVVDICREYGISQATYHRWKSKYGGWGHRIEVLDLSLGCVPDEKFTQGKLYFWKMLAWEGLQPY